jgi:hypothetical protein
VMPGATPLMPPAPNRVDPSRERRERGCHHMR